jgi:prepilin-type N-terminal cleavage/methylation domain-containing protein
MKKRMTHDTRHTTHDAFTLIELIMVMVIIGILFGMGGPLAIQLIDSFQWSIYRKDLSESAEVTLRRMTREIRRLQDDTSVITANATTYRFTDIDSDVIQFQLNGSNLERENNGTTDTLAANVSSFSFTYFDDSGTSIATPTLSPATDIRFVEIAMTLQSDTNTIDYTTRIKLRNVNHIADLFP